MIKEAAAWLVHEPARAKKAGLWAAAAAAAFVVAFAVIIGAAGRSAEPATPGTPPSAAQTAASAGPSPGQPLPAAADVDRVAAAFLTAWLSAPQFEQSKRGHAAWVAALTPYSDRSLIGQLNLAQQDRVPSGPGGTPLTVVQLRPGGEIGETATIAATLSNAATVTVTVTGLPDGWRVIELNRQGW